jgi:hypothetical protein
MVDLPVSRIVQNARRKTSPSLSRTIIGFPQIRASARPNSFIGKGLGMGRDAISKP